MLTQLLSFFAQTPCPTSTFFGIPSWYKYLSAAGRMVVSASGGCELAGNFQWQNGGDITLIGLGILDIVLTLAGLVGVGYVIYGGISYITSDGQPDKTKEAQQTIVNALIGIVLALIAVSSIRFIGGAISA